MANPKVAGNGTAGGRRGARILIYSHDSFGLGHLRRCREIAHALVEADDEASVLILSGSPIIGSFDFRSRVDFVRIPGVIKLRNGEYTSLTLPLAVEDTLSLRGSIIKHTAEVFDPDLFIVDKEPLGLRGEVAPTLGLMNQRGVPCVLGLRDVMDDPEMLAHEWERKHVLPALSQHYDDIWVYGLPQICEPLVGLELPPSVAKRISYTGYLRRPAPAAPQPFYLEKIAEPYVLVTVGGGGDGEAIVDWVLSAYESDASIPHPALIVLGPFMGSEQQADFMARVNRLEQVEALTFHPHVESLMQRAVGVVCMGGYNTFCEVLSFDKRALMIPRTEPRLEQHMRAARAEDLGLVRMLEAGRSERDRSPKAMATALKGLPHQARPSERVIPGLLDGRENVVRLAEQCLARGRQPHLATARSRG
ncbi:glycosyltransferase [Algihabitans albus]|uniref:glycosyltransferase family protein n=1 Tax=Algihabitans albus TaxID=2164067 RepID=UPI0035CF0F81